MPGQDVRTVQPPAHSPTPAPTFLCSSTPAWLLGYLGLGILVFALWRLTLFAPLI